jgi:hypothetical protein
MVGVHRRSVMASKGQEIRIEEDPRMAALVLDWGELQVKFWSEVHDCMGKKT